MRALNRKLLRDLRHNRGVIVSVLTIIAVGTGTFIGLGSAQRTLEVSQHTYYNNYRFGDFWIEVKKAPLTVVDQIAHLPGIAALEARVVFDVILDVPGVIRPLVGRLISTPETGFEDTINGVHLVRGSGFSPDRDNEIILGDAFARAHGLEPGDRVSLILNRKREAFTIVGTAISPEYVYMVRGGSDLSPDPQHFAILYIKERYAREVLDFKDACNQIVGRVVPEARPDIELLLEHMDRLLEPYGVLSSISRERQASHRFLSDEIRGLYISGLITPSIFLAVAALVLNIVMGRIANRQRTIIGTLKAIGYADRDVLLHYLSFGALIGLVGGVAGIIIGVVLARMMIQVYTIFFQFPDFIQQYSPTRMILGILLSLLFAVLGTARGVWGVLQLHPAEAMRPPPPERGGAVFLERFTGLWRRLGFRTHIALRSLARNRTRTATSIIASALSSSIVFLTLSMRDSMMHLIDFQFEQIAHSDLDIAMRDEASRAALYEAQSLPGVDYAEPVLGLVCDVRHGRRARRIGITGLIPEHRLTTPRRIDGEPIEIPSEGLVLSLKLAEILDARVGDRLEVTPVRGRRQTLHVPVASIVNSFLGLDCYADIRYLSGLVGEAYAINSLQLTVNPARRDALYRAIKELPNAQGLSVRADTRRSIEETLIKSMSFSISLLIFFAAVIAFGSIINASLTELADRRRDVSCFRVLGYEPGQVAGIFLRQNLIVFALALLLAYPIGYGLIVFLASNYNTELFRIPVIVRPQTVILTALLASAFVVIAQGFVYWQIRKLDWLEGIQVKE